MSTQTLPRVSTRGQIGHFMLHYFEMCQTEMPERLALNKLKQLIGQFTVGLPGSATLRESIHRSTTADQARDHLERFFAPHLEAELVTT